jgi:hypothetical protein
MSLANATATVTCGVSDGQVTVNGVFVTTALAASATALAFVSPTDGTTAIATASVPNLGILQGAILVCCLNAAGVRKDLLGPYTNLDAAGNLQGVLKFPSIPDSLTPISYHTIKNVTNLFVWGTTNWNASGVTATNYNVSTMPRRPLTAF